MKEEEVMINSHMFARRLKDGRVAFGELRERSISRPGPVSKRRVLDIKILLNDDSVEVVPMTDDEFYAVFGEQRAGDTRRLEGVEYEEMGAVVIPWES